MGILDIEKNLNGPLEYHKIKAHVFVRIHPAYTLINEPEWIQATGFDFNALCNYIGECEVESAWIKQMYESYYTFNNSHIADRNYHILKDAFSALLNNNWSLIIDKPYRLQYTNDTGSKIDIEMFGGQIDDGIARITLTSSHNPNESFNFIIILLKKHIDR